MDVGFNNTNTFEIEELKDVEFLVDATSTEKFELWKECAKEHYDLNKLDSELPCPPIDSFKLFTTDFDNFLSFDIKLELQALYVTAKTIAERNKNIRESRKYRVEWKDDSMGISVKAGEFAGNSIWLSFSFTNINGHKVAFYEATSQVVHHGIVENFLMKHFQRTHDNYTRWNHVDAMNFHNCIRGLDSLDVEPRKTIFKGYNKIEDKTKKGDKKKKNKKTAS